MYDILRFTSAAAGPAMLAVLGLRIAGLISHAFALVDLVVLLVLGVISPVIAGWLRRRHRD